MRHIVLAVTLFFAVGCEYNNYYYGFNDGGAVEAATDSESDDMANPSFFSAGSKLQGSATLSLIAPPVPGVTPAGQVVMVDVVTSDLQPHLCTLSCAWTGFQPTMSGAMWDSELVATLQLGIGGITVADLEVDAVQGVVLSLPVSRIQAALSYRNIRGWAMPVPPPQITAGCSLAEGIIAHAGPPTRTVGDDRGIPIGTTQNYDIPPFARDLTVLAYPDGVSFRLLIVGSAGIPSSVTTLAAFPSATIRLPSTARQVAIDNNGGVALGQLRLVFGLSL